MSSVATSAHPCRRQTTGRSGHGRKSLSGPAICRRVPGVCPRPRSLRHSTHTYLLRCPVESRSSGFRDAVFSEIARSARHERPPRPPSHVLAQRQLCGGWVARRATKARVVLRSLRDADGRSGRESKRSADRRARPPGQSPCHVGPVGRGKPAGRGLGTTSAVLEGGTSSRPTTLPLS